MARDFARHYLPAPVREVLDLSTLEPTKDTFVDAELRQHHSDLLYQVTRREGGSAYIYLLFEHKSYPEPFAAFQVLRYMVRIWEGDRRRAPDAPLRPILPVLLYHGAAHWTVAPDFAALVTPGLALAPHTPDFAYVLCNLSAYSDAELAGGVMQQVALLALKHIFDSGDAWPEALARLMDLLSEMREARDGLDYIRMVLRYLASAASRLAPEVLYDAVQRAFPKDGGALMSTIAQEWIQQGMEQGFAKGFEHGEETGVLQATRASIVEVLRLRFGEVEPEIAVALDQIDDLDRLKALLAHATTDATMAAFVRALRE